MNEIVKMYEDLTNEIRIKYNKILIIDNYDWNRYSPYMIIYLNKNESFDKFKDAWQKNLDKLGDNRYDYTYDDIIYEFDKTSQELFDYFELSNVNAYTDREYELEI